MARKRARIGCGEMLGMTVLVVVLYFVLRLMGML
jgi:hypothetical protein